MKLRHPARKLAALALSLLLLLAFLPTAFAGGETVPAGEGQAPREGAVAKFGNTKYMKVQEAIDAAAPSAGTVHLLQDVEECITISDGSVTLDLSGHTLSADGDPTAQAVIHVKGGTLTIEDTAGNGKVSTSDGQMKALRIEKDSVTLDSGTYSCFVRAGATSLYLVEGDSVPQLAHISNPDNSDRLNLRASPSKSAKSLGKYYNGAVASVLGFSEDGEWVRVDVYGRQGYMQRRYLTLEGDGPNSTRIGIPRVQVTAQSAMFYDVPDTKTEARIMLIRGETVEVMGVIDDTWLHVRYGDLFGYMRRADTDFVE